MNALIKNIGGFFCLAAFSAAMLLPVSCYGHDTTVHMAITGSAYQSSDGLQTFISETLTNANARLTAPQPQTQGPLTVSNWLTIGSEMEDAQTYRFIETIVGSGPRCFDHFYTVQPQRTRGQVIGLTDWSLPFILGGLVKTSTTNSFRWGSDGAIQGPYGLANVYKWSDARNYELGALTNAAPDARNTNMASMFYTLGHILHLNQDLTSPDHVRDDNHVVGAFFEKYGKDNYNYKTNYSRWFAPPPPQNRGWANWQAQGFSQLLDFWDRNKYNNSSGSQGLKDDADGTSGQKLGLAEFSNGNFLGERALYMECYKPGTIHYFPYPRKSSTDFPGNFQSITIRPNGRNLPTIITNNVVTKTRDGVIGFRHSILSYLGTKFPNVPTSHNTTINDDGVLQDYHDRLIPKAVEYSTGILDYFFRGTMLVNVGLANSSFIFTNFNTSGQDFTNGSFYLFQDDTNGNRVLLQKYPLIGVLTNGYSTNLIFSGSALPTNKFLLIYQGTIGITNGGEALDPVDKGIGIAVGEVMSGPIAWWPADGDANDMIGGHDGDEENITYTAGQVGQAFAFDPETFDPVRIRVADDPAFILTNSLSIEGWVRPRGDGSVIFYRGDQRSGFDPYLLSMDGNNNLVFLITDPDGTVAAVQTPLVYNQWSHVAGTLDGDSGSIKLYVNGVLMAQAYTSIRPAGDLTAPDPGIGIGNTHDESWSNFPFYGDIDQISLYPRALSASEVQAIYNVGKAGNNYH